MNDRIAICNIHIGKKPMSVKPILDNPTLENPTYDNQTQINKERKKKEKENIDWALCIPYEINNETRRAFPDFIVVRKDPYSKYVIDILEPHNPDFKDNLGKAKGFAEYARQNPGVGRIQLIRMGKDLAGNNRFKRLDLSKGAVRDKVSHAMSNDELDHIFDTDGFFD